MKVFPKTVAACILLVMSSFAYAVETNYTFDLEFSKGVLTGTVALAEVTLSDVSSIGVESFTPDDDSLLALDFLVGGISFGMEALTDPATDVLLAFRDGEFFYLHYWAEVDGNVLAMVFGAGLLDAVVFTPLVGLGSSGDIIPESFGSVPPVPVPAATWLFCSALLGLGVMKRKKT